MSKRTFELINRWTAGTLQSRKHEGNIYFDSLAIYSYGTHFPIVVKNPSGLLMEMGTGTVPAPVSTNPLFAPL